MKRIVVAGVMASLLVSVVVAQETVLDLPFDDANGIKDQSEIHNITEARNAIVKDGALQLSGKRSYINCGKNESLDIGTEDMTIIVKFKLAPKQPERSGLVSKGAGGPTQSGYAFMYRVPKKAFYFYVGNGKTRSIFQSKTDDLNDGKWHTVAVSLSRQLEVIFALDGKIRGVRKENTIPADNISNPTQNLLIGSWSEAHCLNGSIKDVKIFKTAFTEDKLKDMTKR